MHLYSSYGIRYSLGRMLLKHALLVLCHHMLRAELLLHLHGDRQLDKENSTPSHLFLMQEAVQAEVAH